jgi:putative DNA primase/helicase
MTRRRDTIPTELTSRPRWVLWRRDPVGGKVPYQCNGRKASHSSPSSWCTWTEAQAAFDRGGFAGVGFVLNGDGIVGVDFDHCIERGIIAEKIAAHVAAFASYTEVSPSGSGLHVLLFGKLPPRERRIDGIEVYETTRFLCVTGQHLAGTPLTVNERQAALDAFHTSVFAARTAKHNRVRPPSITSIVSASDAELLDKARRARNGERFSKLYDLGAWQGDFFSQSEADLWLLARLMFWTKGDEARAERLFRGSALMREKWLIESYRERTLERARE